MKSLIQFQKILISGFGLLSLFIVISCGDQKIEVNPGDTPTSEIDLKSSEEDADGEAE